MTIVFLDESGFMLQPLVRRTWALRGQTPVIKSWDRRERLSVISAVSMSPKRRRFKPYFTILSENANTEYIVGFFRNLCRHIRGKMIIVMDRLTAHRSAARALSASKPGRFHFEWLPAYAPELNPVEFIWANTKYGKMANFIAKDVQHLEDRVTQTLVQVDKVLIRGAFKHAKLTT